jgi:hypothetical protein
MANAVSPVQFSAVATGTTATASASLPAASTAGNFLYMMVLTNAGTITAPAGWSTAFNGALGNPCAIFYKENNAGGITAISATLSAAGRWLAHVGEFRSIATSSSIDQTATVSTGGTTNYPSGTITPTVAGELVLALIGEGSSDTFSAPSGGFTLQAQASGGATTAMAAMWGIATGIATYAAGLTGGGVNPHSGIIASFKAATTAGGGTAGIIVNPGMGDFQ